MTGGRWGGALNPREDLGVWNSGLDSDSVLPSLSHQLCGPVSRVKEISSEPTLPAMRSPLSSPLLAPPIPLTAGVPALASPDLGSNPSSALTEPRLPYLQNGGGGPSSAGHGADLVGQWV